MLGGGEQLNFEDEHVIKAPVITQTCQNLFSPPRLSASKSAKSASLLGMHHPGGMAGLSSMSEQHTGL